MATITQRKDKDGKIRFYVRIRMKGNPPEHASF